MRYVKQPHIEVVVKHNENSFIPYVVVSLKYEND